MSATRVNLEDLAKLSDIVIVCASLNDSTKNIIDKRFLSNMKKTGFLINTSRGGLVDQEALVEALKERKIKGVQALGFVNNLSYTFQGAGLDVMTPEPLPPNNPLASCPNLVLLPHMGSATTKTREDMAKLTVSNIIAALNGQTMPASIV